MGVYRRQLPHDGGGDSPGSAGQLAHVADIDAVYFPERRHKGRPITGDNQANKKPRSWRAVCGAGGSGDQSLSLMIMQIITAVTSNGRRSGLPS